MPPLSAPPLAGRAVPMPAHAGGADHRDGAVASLGHSVENAVPDAGRPPPDDAVVERRPRPVPLRHVAPRRPGPEAPQDAVDHAPVVDRRDAPRLGRQLRLETARPALVGSCRSMSASSLHRDRKEPANLERSVHGASTWNAAADPIPAQGPPRRSERWRRPLFEPRRARVRSGAGRRPLCRIGLGRRADPGKGTAVGTGRGTTRPLGARANRDRSGPVAGLDAAGGRGEPIRCACGGPAHPPAQRTPGLPLRRPPRSPRPIGAPGRCGARACDAGKSCCPGSPSSRSPRAQEPPQRRCARSDRRIHPPGSLNARAPSPRTGGPRSDWMGCGHVEPAEEGVKAPVGPCHGEPQLLSVERHWCRSRHGGGLVAQRIEHRFPKPGVVGSSPTGATNTIKGLREFQGLPGTIREDRVARG